MPYFGQSEEALQKRNLSYDHIINKPPKDVNYTTQFYLWNSNVNKAFKKDDLNLKERLKLGTEPARIPFFDNKLLKYVYCGIRHSGVITEDGELYMFGKNLYGNLGIGNNFDYSHVNPQLVSYFVDKEIKIKKVCCSEYNTVALSEDGDVYTWGYAGRRAKHLALIKG